ncbi:MAG: hypothetical protein ACTH8F_10575 [Microbacterium sp.]|uniref:hypothetical protein n=1 Tax=Microbacterium sp. TaxID=51671 RepID=UPI003F96497C
MAKVTGIDYERVVTDLAVALTEMPWGSLSKSELEFRAFQFLIAAGKVSLVDTDTALAAQLETTPARIRAMRFRHEQSASDPWERRLVEVIVPHSVGEKGDLQVYVDSTYLLDRLVDEMRKRQFLVRRTLTRGLVRLDPVDLFVVLYELGLFVPEEKSKGAGKSKKADRQPAAENLRGRLNEIFKNGQSTDRTTQLESVLNTGAAVTQIASFAKGAISLLFPSS